MVGALLGGIRCLMNGFYGLEREALDLVMLDFAPWIVGCSRFVMVMRRANTNIFVSQYEALLSSHDENESAN